LWALPRAGPRAVITAPTTDRRPCAFVSCGPSVLVQWTSTSQPRVAASDCQWSKPRRSSSTAVNNSRSRRVLSYYPSSAQYHLCTSKGVIELRPTSDQDAPGGFSGWPPTPRRDTLQSNNSDRLALPSATGSGGYANRWYLQDRKGPDEQPACARSRAEDHGRAAKHVVRALTDRFLHLHQ
jgi:hypothetical protein